MRRIAIGTLVLMLTAAACSSDTTAGGTTGDGAHGTTGMTHGGGAKCSPSGTTLAIAAKDIAYSTDCLAAPANTAFTITFDNEDTLQHNIAILDKPHSDASAKRLFTGDIFEGPASRDYAVGSMTAGTYHFHCDVHNQMSGTFEVA